jgi:hypothetical protein
MLTSLLLLSVPLVSVFLSFALKQKVEPKMEASPNRSVRFAAHAQQHPTAFCIILMLPTALQQFLLE